MELLLNRSLQEGSSEISDRSLYRFDSTGQYVPSPDELFERERDAFQGLLPTLLMNYAGRYVAIHGGRYAGDGQTDTEVARAFFAQHGDVPVYIGFVGSEPPAYQISPRR